MEIIYNTISVNQQINQREAKPSHKVCNGCLHLVHCKLIADAHALPSPKRHERPCFWNLPNQNDTKTSFNTISTSLCTCAPQLQMNVPAFGIYQTKMTPRASFNTISTSLCTCLTQLQMNVPAFRIY